MFLGEKPTAWRTICFLICSFIFSLLFPSNCCYSLSHPCILLLLWNLALETFPSNSIIINKCPDLTLLVRQPPRDKCLMRLHSLLGNYLISASLEFWNPFFFLTNISFFAISKQVIYANLKVFSKLWLSPQSWCGNSLLLTTDLLTPKLKLWIWSVSQQQQAGKGHRLEEFYSHKFPGKFCGINCVWPSVPLSWL